MSLEEKLEEALRVSFDREDTTVVHPRYLSYKTRLRNETPQEQRRNAILQHQKQNRNSLLNGHRLGLPSSLDELKKLEKQLRKEEKKEKIKQEYEESGKLMYKGVLMLSEWMIDVPHDLQTNWIIKACPEGKRTLVIATRGWTRAFGRNGHEIAKFPSSLPGGAFTSSAAKRGSCANVDSSGVGSLTILDCIFVRSSSTFYILDIVYWGCDMVNCEAEFRFFWLDSKLDELKIIDDDNNETVKMSEEGSDENKMEEDVPRKQKKPNWKYKFRRVARVSYRDLEEGLVYPFYPPHGRFQVKLDGLLFYHREGLYTWKGPKSPLVVWLKPFMLQDILNFPVHPGYIQEKPPVYNSVQMDCTNETAEKGESIETNPLDQVMTS